ncbi:MAG: hypothetical protein WB762_08465 [Candidatus Sulfotelmatobacter sp.]
MDELRRGVKIMRRIAAPEGIGEEMSGRTASPVVVRALAARSDPFRHFL